MKTLSLIEKLEKKITLDMEKTWMPFYAKQAGYVGNGIYGVSGTNLQSTDTRELFLMFVACKVGIKLPKER
jgi:hypothetical protein